MKKTHISLFLALALLFFLNIISCSLGALAYFDPKIDWKVTKTKHFDIIYDANQQELSNLYANYAESALQILRPIFKDVPDKIILIINDQTDQANGAATRIPYPHIIAHPVLPDNRETIGEYGNWGFELVLHELTHILTFEPVGGIFKGLRYVFGSISSPNLLLPRWYHEGLAVKMESDLTSHGRLRSPQLDAEIRALVEEDVLELENIASANETGIIEWPFGQRPYLFGSLLWHKMVQEKGLDIVSKLNQRYGRRVPFLLESPFKEHFDSYYNDLLLVAFDDVEEIAKSQIEKIKKGNTLKAEELDTEGLVSHFPVLSPKGDHLAFLTRGHNWNSEIVILNRQKNKNSKKEDSHDAEFSIVDPLGSGKDREGVVDRLEWHPSGNKIIYDKSGSEFNRYYIYSDLYERDLSDFKKEKRLTEGMRAKEAAYSLDGKSIVYVQISPGSTAIGHLDSSGKNKTILYAPPLQYRVSQPSFLSEHLIVFSERNTEGKEVLITFDLRSKKSVKILENYSPAYSPRPTHLGVMFVSSTSGVPNLYLASRDLKSARPITNVTTGIVNGDVDRRSDLLYLEMMTGHGPQIMVSENGTAEKVNPPKIERINTLPPPPKVNLNEKLEATTKNYSAFPYILPRFWIPMVSFLQGGGVIYEATTFHFDPLQKHSYSLLGTYNSLTSLGGGYFTYTNQQTIFPTTVYASRFNDYFVGLDESRTNETAGILLGSNLYKTSKAWKMGLGWTYSKREVLDITFYRVGPSVGFGYDSTSQKGHEISPEKGQKASLGYTHYLSPKLGDGRLDYEQYDGEYSLFFSKWLPERQVVYFHTKGTWGNFDSPLLVGSTTSSAAFQTTLITGDFLMRGYPSGSFLGTKMWGGNIEYRFPVSTINRGADTTPFFAKRTHGRVFVDGIATKGLYYNFTEESYKTSKMKDWYFSVGGELHLETTLGYALPITFYAGLYYGLYTPVSGGDVAPFIGIAL
ncbi:MAG: hypothetical protein SGJ18_04495 [Pseudomonadota bacterium]|nr:hypothetical protein [Pseudomonadota bacterium]